MRKKSLGQKRRLKKDKRKLSNIYYVNLGADKQLSRVVLFSIFSTQKNRSTLKAKAKEEKCMTEEEFISRFYLLMFVVERVV